jgi:hypothetical protein
MSRDRVAANHIQSYLMSRKHSMARGSTHHVFACLQQERHYIAHLARCCEVASAATKPSCSLACVIILVII